MMSQRVLQVEELRQRLDEKNRHIEKKTAAATQATQERNRLNNELNELRDHMDIKDRKINVLQRKVGLKFVEIPQVFAYVLPSFGSNVQCLKQLLFDLRAPSLLLSFMQSSLFTYYYPN